MAVNRAALTVVEAPLVAVGRTRSRPRIREVTAVVLAGGALATSVALSVGLLSVVASACLLAVALASAGAGPVRAELKLQAARRAKRLRREQRERVFEQIGLGCVVLAELTRLVDEISACDPDLARRFDLEALLDRHVELSVAHARGLRAVRMADRVQLERTRDRLQLDLRSNPKRLALCERRIQFLEQCERKTEWLADELEMLTDAIELIAQRVMCPDDLPVDDVVECWLTELDDSDAASHQLEAELDDADAATDRLAELSAAQREPGGRGARARTRPVSRVRGARGASPSPKSSTNPLDGGRDGTVCDLDRDLGHTRS